MPCRRLRWLRPLLFMLQAFVISPPTLLLPLLRHYAYVISAIIVFAIIDCLAFGIRLFFSIHVYYAAYAMITIYSSFMMLHYDMPRLYWRLRLSL